MRTSRMLMLLGAALLALTSTRCNCGPEYGHDLGCNAVHEHRCYNGDDPALPHPYGAIAQTCYRGLFGNPDEPLSWSDDWCFLCAGDGGNVCMPDGYCYCPPVH